MDKITEPTIKFEIEIRPAGLSQKEAGRKFFSRLLEKTRRGNSEAGNQNAVGAAGDTAQPSPAPAPHSLSGGQNLQNEDNLDDSGEKE